MEKSFNFLKFWQLIKNIFYIPCKPLKLICASQLAVGPCKIKLSQANHIINKYGQ